MTTKDIHTPAVLIDLFVVPESGVEEFLESAKRIQAFIKGLPGFVEGFIHAKTGGDGSHNYVTTAVWESAAALERAKGLVAAELQRRGVDPQALRRRLGIQVERGVYARSPY